MSARRFPRILDGVHAVPSARGTLLGIPGHGQHWMPSALYALLDRVAPLLDGFAELNEVLERIPSSHAAMVRRALEGLEDCGAVRSSDRPRPKRIPAEILASADTACGPDDDPYLRCEMLLDAEVTVEGPRDWHEPLVAAFNRLGITRVTAVDGPTLRVGLSVAAARPVRVAADLVWTHAPRGAVERAVAAAVVVTEATSRSLGHPPRSLPGPDDMPGLERSGPRTSATEVLLEEWPDADVLRQLLLDPGSLLPQRDPGLQRPAGIRPCAGRRGPALPTALRDILQCVHGILRWESGELAHGGGRAHRGVASARALYPVELYVVEGSRAWYVEPGDLGLALVSADGGGPAEPMGDQVTVVLTVREGKVAHRYLGYATRLCLQEAGLTLAALRDAASVLGISACTSQRLGARGTRDQWGSLLQLGEDERTVASIRLNLPAAAERAPELQRHLDIVRSRHSGHAVFNALGADPEPDLSTVLNDLAVDLGDSLTCVVVTHRGVRTAQGRVPQGAFAVRPCGWEQLSLGPGPTEALQRGQERLGWLAPDYTGAEATVVLAAGIEDATKDLQAMHDLTMVAAQMVHRLLLAAASIGKAARIHNSLRMKTFIEATGQGNVAPLFQVLIGTPRPDGTLVVDVGDVIPSTGNRSRPGHLADHWTKRTSARKECP